jgi:hypothetical protein
MMIHVLMVYKKTIATRLVEVNQLSQTHCDNNS